MKVVQLGPWPPPHGGVQTNLVSIRRYLRERGHSCAVINLTRHRPQDGDEIYYPSSAAGVLRIMHRLSADIYHLHVGGMPTPRVLALCIAFAAKPGAKSVLSFHSGGYPTSPEGQSAPRFSLRRMAFRAPDAIIAVNPAIEQMFHRFGIPPGRVHLIYPFETMQPSDAPYPEALATFVRAHRPFLFTVGLLEPEYDLPLQIETLGRVRERYPSAGLAIAGAGSTEQDLRRLIASKPWAEHVLLWGDMPHSVTLRAIAECDVLLRTTHYDGDSISVREAIALGTPVIATDNGMRPPDVRLIPPRDGAALAAAIEQALECARGGAGARRLPERDDSNLAEVLRVYERLLAKC